MIGKKSRNVRKYIGKFQVRKFPITAEEISDVAYVLHKAAKEKGNELECPSYCAKEVLKFLGYDVDYATNNRTEKAE